jgi:hypothetical protein
MTVNAKVRPAVDSAAAKMWGRLLNAKLDELRAEKTRLSCYPFAVASSTSIRDPARPARRRVAYLA